MSIIQGACALGVLECLRVHKGRLDLLALNQFVWGDRINLIYLLNLIDLINPINTIYLIDSINPIYMINPIDSINPINMSNPIDSINPINLINLIDSNIPTIQLNLSFGWSVLVNVIKWIVGVLSFQKMCGLYDLKDHIMEISGYVTDRGPLLLPCHHLSPLGYHPPTSLPHCTDFVT